MENAVVACNRFFDLVWLPFLKRPWYFDFFIISLVSAFLFLIIFKKVSNQKQIRFYKNKILGHILYIRLYKDHPILTLKMVLHILGYQVMYFRYTLTPMIVIFLPLLVISVQINNRYGYLPFKGDDHFMIEVKLDETAMSNSLKNLRTIRWNTSRGISIDSPPLRMLSEGSIIWRAKVISIQAERQYFQVSTAGTGETVEKRIVTRMNNQRFSPKKQKWDLKGLFVNNGEGFISKTAPFKSITVSYERAGYPLLAWDIDPILLYFILTLLLSLIFKPLVRVSI